MKRLKLRVKELRKDAGTLYLALSDRRTPWPAKVMAALTLAYLLSPIDLIPDIIPVLGLLDDLLIVPALILLTIRLIPQEVLNDIKQNPKQQTELRKKWYFALPVLLVYLILVYFTFKWLAEMFWNKI